MSKISAVHRAAADGFGTSSDAYDRGRPGYPPASIAIVAEIVRAGPGGPIVDVAAGTGIFTRSLFEIGLRPIAVEPLPAMRERLVRSLPGVATVAAIAEALPFADAALGAITVAQAFHWFDGRRTLEGLAAIARPGAPLIVIFNVLGRSDDVQAGLDEIWEPYRGVTPTHRSGAWRSAFDDQSWFSPLERASFPHEQRVDADGLVARVLSVSFIATQPVDERARIAQRVRGLVQGQEIMLPYRTDVWWSRRMP